MLRLRRYERISIGNRRFWRGSVSFNQIFRYRGRRPPATIFARIDRPVNALQLCRWQSGLPISDNWTFFARCYGWGATSGCRLKIGVTEPTGVILAHNFRRRGRPPPTILPVGKNGWWIFHVIEMWTEVSFVLSQFTRLTDGRMDIWLMAIPALHTCSAVTIRCWWP